MTLAPVNIRTRIIPTLALVKIPPRIIPTLALVKIRSYKKSVYIFSYSWSWYQWINWQKYIFSKTCKIFISTLSIFFIFYFFLFFFGLGWPGPAYIYFGGWAQLSPYGLGWAQPAQPGHWPKPVARLGKASKKHVWSGSTRACIVRR